MRIRRYTTFVIALVTSLGGVAVANADMASEEGDPVIVQTSSAQQGVSEADISPQAPSGPESHDASETDTSPEPHNDPESQSAPACSTAAPTKRNMDVESVTYLDPSQTPCADMEYTLIDYYGKGTVDYDSSGYITKFTQLPYQIGELELVPHREDMCTVFVGVPIALPYKAESVTVRINTVDSYELSGIRVHPYMTVVSALADPSLPQSFTDAEAIIVDDAIVAYDVTPGEVFKAGWTARLNDTACFMGSRVKFEVDVIIQVDETRHECTAPVEPAEDPATSQNTASDITVTPATASSATPVPPSQTVPVLAKSGTAAHTLISLSTALIILGVGLLYVRRKAR
ncbi:MAG: hypothetical protein GX483_07155 [Actinomycetaceae bacterium]|nr:hypothetical protein [Actinomycetaceae bacterium]